MSSLKISFATIYSHAYLCLPTYIILYYIDITTIMTGASIPKILPQN